MPHEWFIYREGKQYGPISDPDFRKLGAEGQLTSDDLIWREGFANWQRAAEIMNGLPPQSAADEAELLPRKQLQEATSVTTIGGNNTAKRSRRWLSGTTIFWVLFGLFIIAVTFAEPAAIPYRITRALTGALFGAIGGGLGGLLEFLIRRRWGTTAMSIGVVLGFIVGQTIEQSAQLVGDKVYDQAVRPVVDRAVVERRLVSDPRMPFYKTLRDFQPDRFKRIVDEMFSRAQEGQNLEEIINEIRKREIEPLLASSVPYLSDETIVRYANLIVGQMEAFRIRQPRLCVYALRGQPLGDIRPYLTESLMIEELRLLDAAIRADSSSRQARYTQADQNKIMDAVVMKLAEQHGEGIRLLEPNAVVTGQEEKVCKVAADFFGNIAALPPPEAAALLRSILIAGAP